MSYTRQEIEDAFTNYQAVAAKAAAANEWRAWADMFTDDAEYVEHHFGNFHGRQAIYEWITDTMHIPPNDEMNAFPIEWYVIDEQKGWVVCKVQNRMRDPGDGSVHQEANWTLLKYAGNNQWSYEEDMYNPLEFGRMIEGWQAALRAAGG
jgi:SnoaL-like domain